TNSENAGFAELLSGENIPADCQSSFLELDDDEEQPQSERVSVYRMLKGNLLVVGQASLWNRARKWDFRQHRNATPAGLREFLEEWTSTSAKK
ncbi:MAG: hypothetical protein ACRCXM_05405, partial [Beijerinckiaceae bacterium]